MKAYMDRRVSSESQGALSLASFAKTNGFEQELTHLYVLEWQAEVSFARQGWKPGDAIGGYWNDFSVMPAQSGFLTGSWIHFDQGTRLRLRGDCTMRRTEQGWRIEAFDTKSYQKLAWEQAPAAVRPPNTQESRAALEVRLDAGETVTVPLTYNSATYGYTYMADGTVTMSRTQLAFKPTHGSNLTPAFEVSPQAVEEIRLENSNPQRLHVRVGITNEKGKVKARDYYWYPRGARAVGGGPGGQGASIDCTACDDTLSTLQSLASRMQRLPPAGPSQASGAVETSRLAIGEPLKAGTQRGACVTLDSTPMYSGSRNEKVDFTIAQGDCVAGFKGFEREGTRVHVTYIPPNRIRDFEGWMNPSALAFFDYDCGCDKKDKCAAVLATFGKRQWNDCFKTARDKFLAGAAKPTPQPLAR